MRNEAFVGGAAEGLVEGTEACTEEVAEVFDYDVWGAFADAGLEMNTVVVSKRKKI